MRRNPIPEAERGRLRAGPYRTARQSGPTGAYTLRAPTGASLRVLASDGLGWEHASVTILDDDRTPTWAEMAFVKECFWRADETVMQLHVPTTDHVNCHPGCLHLWRPTGGGIPRPPAAFVGPKGGT